MKLVGYDCETWSSHEISKGLEHYFADPDFAIICAASADDNGVRVQELYFGIYVAESMDSLWCAHNAQFDRTANEIREKGRTLAVGTPMWFDTMVGVRAVLGASLGRNSYLSLDKSAKLLLPSEFHKDKAGAELMPYFSFPSPKNQFGRIHWKTMIEKYPSEWADYMAYCQQDAMVAYQLAALTREHMGNDAFFRLVYEAEITYRMNRAGWPIDTKLLRVMADRAQENTEKSLDNLIEEYNPGWSTVKKRTGEEVFKPLNLNSGAQLKKWLGERDIIVENTQADTITETIEFIQDNLDNRPDWVEALAVLRAKADLGGATLKKLAPITNKIGKDGRLRDMYNHISASSTHRTTSGGVQMQNLKRLPDDVEDLTEEFIATMDNNQLAVNIRQLFASQEDGGQIIVADLKSIEGLLVGWVFGVDWMVEAVRDGKDMYKMSAAERFKVQYDLVLPEQRRTAKTGVLAGNYGGGKRAYAKASGGRLSEEEADKDKAAYRETIPTLVQSWWDLNDMLIEACEAGSAALRLYNGYSVIAEMVDTEYIELDEESLEVTLLYQGKAIFSRWWHGVRLEEDENGRKEITYAVLDERKTAEEPYKRTTSTGEKYRLYGGKLTGTLIQSLARELYFFQLGLLGPELEGKATIIGQLHDEVVVEWVPESSSAALSTVEQVIERNLTEVPWYLAGCPVKVKVSHAPRYIK